MTPVGEQGGNIARAAALYAGLPYHTTGMQVNRFCVSSLEAVQIAAAKIMAGWDDMILVGGLESMSRVSEGSDGGALMFDPDVRAKVNFIPRNISADLLATLEGYSREQIDAYALEMHLRALSAYNQPQLYKSILPIFDINGLPVLQKNECFKQNVSAEWLQTLAPLASDSEDKGYDTMATLRYPQIAQVNHVHTEGSSAPLADGAAMLLLGNRVVGEKLGLQPRARIVAASVIGVEPTLMLHGASLAAEKALKFANLKSKDIELWESNELFAAVGIKFLQEMQVAPEKVNVFGSDLAWGYAAGAMGAIALGTLLDGLELHGLKRGAVALCARSGMASALIIERP
jgi:acetyl-CoA C-acetyltransferase